MRLKLRKQLNRDTGSALIWSMAVLLVLSILLTSVLSIGLAYANRSNLQNNRRQAYFTARSGAEMLSDAICSKSASGNVLLDELNQTQSISLPDLDFHSEMGTCSAEITMEEMPEEGKVIRIVTSAEYRGSKHAMRVTLVPGETDVTLSNAFYQRGIYMEDTGNSGNLMIQRNIDLGADTDFYFKLGEAAGKDITFQLKGDTKVLMRRNLLANRPLSLNNSTGSPANCHIHGMIVSDQDITLTGVTVGAVSGDKCGGTTTQSGIYSQGKVNIGGNSVIYGDIVAKSVTISDTAIVMGKIGTIGGTTEILGQGKHEGADYPLTVNPIPSRLPTVNNKVITPPSGSVTYRLPESDIRSGQRIGSGDSTATYYYIDSSINLPSTSIFTKANDTGKIANGPIYIFLRAGAKVNIASVQPDASASFTGPRVIFVLENSSTELTIGNKSGSPVDCAAHIVGEGSVTLENNVRLKGVLSVTGALSWLTQGSGNFLQIDSEKPPVELSTVTGGGSGGTDGAQIVLGWKVQRYEEVDVS